MSDPAPTLKEKLKLAIPTLPEMAEKCAQCLTDDSRAELARWLELPIDCLRALPGLGWCPPISLWTFPETDRHGTLIGLTVRSPEKPLRLFPDSRRGLSLLAGWADGPGPLFLPLGVLDALALAAIGLPAIGRSGSEDELDDLAALLGSLDPKRKVIVVGNNDCDGDDETGMEAVLWAADELAARLGRPVRWIVPPPTYDDVRHWVIDWLKRDDDGPADADLIREVGQSIAQVMTTAAQTVLPDDAAPREARFPLPVPLSALAPPGAETEWVWHGFLARDGITLLSALPKCGKTTLLTHLLAALPNGGSFLGRSLVAGRAVVVSEEPAGIWATRRDALNLTDAIRIIPRGELARPTADSWADFVAHLTNLLKTDPADLVVFDSLASVWPVRDENNATEVERALYPLHRLCRGRSILLIHHIRKNDGREGTAARGSGALTAFVDLILEMRRVKAADGERTQRRLTTFGRYDDSPPEWTIELTPGPPPGYAYRPPKAEGDDAPDPLRAAILAVLPADGTGLTRKEIWEKLPEELRPGESKFLTILEAGVGTQWVRTGNGGRSAFRYAVAAMPGNFSISQPPGF